MTSWAEPSRNIGLGAISEREHRTVFTKPVKRAAEAVEATLEGEGEAQAEISALAAAVAVARAAIAELSKP